MATGLARAQAPVNKGSMGCGGSVWQTWGNLARLRYDLDKYTGVRYPLLLGLCAGQGAPG